MYGTAILLIIIFAFGIFLAIEIPFILNIQNTLKAIAPHNRKMEPQMAWIMIIPLVATVWIFILSKRLAQSIESELKERGIPVKPEPTYMAGLVFGILSAVSIVVRWIDISPIVSGIIGIASIVFFILYWVKVAEFKNILLQPRPYIAPHEAEQNSSVS